MLDFVKKYGGNVHSQFGEDFIIAQALHRIGINKGVSVEFGGHDGYFCSNTRVLIDSGWKGYMYDMNPGHPEVENKEVTPENVNELPECDVLSIDTDGPCYGIWQAYKGKPAIVVIEINSSLHPMEEHFSKGKGASYISMLRLGISKGYFLLCHTGNMIFLLNEYRYLFDEIIGDGMLNWEYYFNKSWQ